MAYLHSLDGRLRIKLTEVRRAPHAARAVEERLRSVAGVTDASANPATGNVLVLYDCDLTSTGAIVDALQTWGYLRARPPATDLIDLGSMLLRATAEVALQRLLMRFI
jgi:copper chaperone CopZ